MIGHQSESALSATGQAWCLWVVSFRQQQTLLHLPSATRGLKHVPSGKIVRPQSVDQQWRSQRNGSLSTPALSGDGCQPQGSCQILQWLHGEKNQAIQTFMIYLINQHNQNTFLLTRCLKIINETFHILQALRAVSGAGMGLHAGPSFWASLCQFTGIASTGP